MSKESGLIYVPILHTRQEADGIAHAGRHDAGPHTLSPTSVDYDRSVGEMWDGISRKIEEANIVHSKVRIYQDAMPVCGMEQDITETLARQGSRNHRLILDLIRKGAHLEGTEDPALLVQEYDALSALLAVADRQNRAAFKDYQSKSAALMEKRDAFITDRIKSTVREGELPLVFMGVRHRLDQRISSNFIITFLIYRLPFRKIGDIYNV